MLLIIDVDFYSEIQLHDYFLDIKKFKHRNAVVVINVKEA